MHLLFEGFNTDSAQLDNPRVYWVRADSDGNTLPGEFNVSAGGTTNVNRRKWPLKVGSGGELNSARREAHKIGANAGQRRGEMYLTISTEFEPGDRYFLVLSGVNNADISGTAAPFDFSQLRITAVEHNRDRVYNDGTAKTEVVFTPPGYRYNRAFAALGLAVSPISGSNTTPIQRAGFVLTIAEWNAAVNYDRTIVPPLGYTPPPVAEAPPMMIGLHRPGSTTRVLEFAKTEEDHSLHEIDIVEYEKELDSSVAAEKAFSDLFDGNPKGMELFAFLKGSPQISLFNYRANVESGTPPSSNLYETVLFDSLNHVVGNAPHVGIRILNDNTLVDVTTVLTGLAGQYRGQNYTARIVRRQGTTDNLVQNSSAPIVIAKQGDTGSLVFNQATFNTGDILLVGVGAWTNTRGTLRAASTIKLTRGATVETLTATEDFRFEQASNDGLYHVINFPSTILVPSKSWTGIGVFTPSARAVFKELLEEKDKNNAQQLEIATLLAQEALTNYNLRKVRDNFELLATQFHALAEFVKTQYSSYTVPPAIVPPPIASNPNAAVFTRVVFNRQETIPSMVVGSKVGDFEVNKTNLAALADRNEIAQLSRATSAWNAAQNPTGDQTCTLKISGQLELFLRRQTNPTNQALVHFSAFDLDLVVIDGESGEETVLDEFVTINSEWISAAEFSKAYYQILSEGKSPADSFSANPQRTVEITGDFTVTNAGARMSKTEGSPLEVNLLQWARNNQGLIAGTNFNTSIFPNNNSSLAVRATVRADFGQADCRIGFKNVRLQIDGVGSV